MKNRPVAGRTPSEEPTSGGSDSGEIADPEADLGGEDENHTSEGAPDPEREAAADVVIESVLREAGDATADELAEVLSGEQESVRKAVRGLRPLARRGL